MSHSLPPIRKLAVGSDPGSWYIYQVGSTIRLGPDRSAKVSAILAEDNLSRFNIYLTDGDVEFQWKTVQDCPVNIEYFVNFEDESGTV